MKASYVLFSVLLLSSCVANKSLQNETSLEKIDWNAYKNQIDTLIDSGDGLHTKYIRKAFLTSYVNRSMNKAFAQSESGAWGYKSGFDDVELVVEAALGHCELSNRGFRNTKPCKIVNVNGVWGSMFLLELD